jgi:HEAT repeat protein
MSIPHLIATALGADDDEATWSAITDLQKRGSREVFDAVLALVTSTVPLHRERATIILAQLGTTGWAGGDLSTACADALCPLLRDPVAGVRVGAAYALATRKDHRGFPTLIAETANPDRDIRWAVVNALTGSDDRSATDALIAMTRDSDDLIRDWAAFSLASQTDADYPELRDALIACLSDNDEVTRGEAHKGLAKRRDERAIGALIGELAALGSVSDTYELDCCLEAVALWADPRFVGPLEALQQSLVPGQADWGPKIQDAIAGCKPKAVPSS